MLDLMEMHLHDSYLKTSRPMKAASPAVGTGIMSTGAIAGVALDVSNFLAEVCSDLTQMLTAQLHPRADLLYLVEQVIEALVHPFCLDTNSDVSYFPMTDLCALRCLNRYIQLCRRLSVT